jgi:hypothetical protein
MMREDRTVYDRGSKEESKDVHSPVATTLVVYGSPVMIAPSPKPSPTVCVMLMSESRFRNPGLVS